MNNVTLITFAFDYDETWTLDPIAFAMMAEGLRDLGHRVLLVTARATGHAEVLDACELYVDRVIFTPGVPKRVECKRLGERVDVWVDDKPEMVDQVR